MNSIIIKLSIIYLSYTLRLYMRKISSQFYLSLSPGECLPVFREIHVENDGHDSSSDDHDLLSSIVLTLLHLAMIVRSSIFAVLHLERELDKHNVRPLS